MNGLQLARKNYDQGMLVSFDYYGDTIQPMFYSPSGVANEQMKITISGQNSQPIVPQEDPMDISVEFFYSVNKVSTADELVKKNAVASKIHIVKVSVVAYSSITTLTVSRTGGENAWLFLRSRHDDAFHFCRGHSHEQPVPHNVWLVRRRVSPFTCEFGLC